MGLFDNKKRPNGLLGDVSSEGLLALANSLYQQGQPSTTPRGGLNLAAPMLAYKQANKGNETDRFYLQLGIDPKNPQRDFLAKNILGKQMGTVGTPDQQNFFQAKRTGFTGTFADYMQVKDDPTLMAQFMQGTNTTNATNQEQQNNVDIPETPPKKENIEFFNYPRPNERVTDVDVANGVGTVYRNGVPQQVTLKGGKKDKELQGLIVGGRAAINGLRPVSVAIKNIGTVINENPNAVGIVGKFAQIFPSDARSIRESLKTLQAYSGFSTLADMKKASPTGGALGQVSERELDLLQATWTSLDPNLGAKEFKRRMDSFNTQLDSVISGIELGMEESGITDPVAIDLIKEMKNLSSAYKDIGQAQKSIDDMSPEEIEAELNS